jgi:hypothetical protein
MSEHHESALDKDRSPILKAILVLLGLFIAGVILIALGHVFIGIMVGCAGIPAALIAWLTAY